jgi:signal transduction histidine kinase
MVAGVCHEVSNPLAAVHSMLQILQSKRGVTPDTLEKGLASISANVARVLAITRKLGDFSRVGTDPPSPVCVDAAMEEALGLLRHSSHGARVRVIYRGAPEARVLARPAMLQYRSERRAGDERRRRNRCRGSDRRRRRSHPHL